MREIKFRVWDKKIKFMISWNKLLEAYDLHNLLELTDKRFEIMQFTGLKDKNGKEIFEGDIIEYKNTNWVVRFEMGSFSLFTGIENLSESLIEKPKTDNEMLADELGIWWTRCKVIGNKFENPELLEEK